MKNRECITNIVKTFRIYFPKNYIGFDEDMITAQLISLGEILQPYDDFVINQAVKYIITNYRKEPYLADLMEECERIRKEFYLELLNRAYELGQLGDDDNALWLKAGYIKEIEDNKMSDELKTTLIGIKVLGDKNGNN